MKDAQANRTPKHITAPRIDEPNLIPLTFSIEPDLLATLREAARREERSVSQLVRRFIRQALAPS